MRVIVCIMILFFSCENHTISDKNKGEAVKNQKNEISKATIENFKYTDYGLSQEAKDIVKNWSAYKALEDQINYLKKADLSFYKSDKKELVTFITELKTTIPDVLNEEPISSRLVVIETRILKLNDNLVLDNIDTSLQLLSIKEMLAAFSNLNLHINKLLEFKTYNTIRPE